MNRTCSKCKRVLLIAEFGKKSQRKDGINLWCKDCCRNKVNLYRSTEEGARKHREQEKSRYANNPQPIKERAKKHHWNNRVDVLKKMSQRFQIKMLNPEFRKKNNERLKAWSKQNPVKNLERVNRRRALKKQALPIWLTAIEKCQIEEFYEISLAKSFQTGIKHHVDHIFPLKGKGYNGLHVPWNLQILTQEQNDKKATKFPEQFSYMSWEAA
jgi:hypothetical protein